MASDFILYENIAGFFLFEILEREMIVDRFGTNSYENIANINKIVKLRSKYLFNEHNYLKIYAELKENKIPSELHNFLKLNPAKIFYCDSSLQINLLNLGFRVKESQLIMRGIRHNEMKLLRINNNLMQRRTRTIAEKKMGEKHESVIFFDENKKTINELNRTRERLKMNIGESHDFLSKSDCAQQKIYEEVIEVYDRMIYQREKKITSDIKDMFPLTASLVDPMILFDLLRIYGSHKNIIETDSKKIYRLLSKYRKISAYEIFRVDMSFLKELARRVLFLMRMDYFKSTDRQTLQKYKSHMDGLYEKFKKPERKNISLIKKIKMNIAN